MVYWIVQEKETMADQPPQPRDIMLDHLRALREGQDRIESKLGEHDKHFSLLERQVAGPEGGPF